jgi:hypothetical protein
VCRAAGPDDKSIQARANGCGSTAGRARTLTCRFPLIVEFVARLRWRSCIIDGEAVACDDAGMSKFQWILTADTTPLCSCKRSRRSLRPRFP